MAVYFIMAERSGHIKVGFSDDPQSRLSQLQTANFEKLVLLGSIPGDVSLEREIHRRLAAFRMNGTEWFEHCNEVRQEVYSRLNPGRPPRIYFAGKVRGGDDDYRTSLLTDWTGCLVRPMECDETAYRRSKSLGWKFETFVYSGPFTIRKLWKESAGSAGTAPDCTCFHGLEPGCSVHDPGNEVEAWLPPDWKHGAASHGCGLTEIEEAIEVGSLDRDSPLKGDFCGNRRSDLGITLGEPGDHNGFNLSARNLVVERCLTQIRSCDRVHAFIDTPDCYGTIAEIGYAVAMGKPVWVVFSPQARFVRPEMWFVEHASFSCSVGDATSMNRHELFPIWEKGRETELPRPKSGQLAATCAVPGRLALPPAQETGTT